MLTARPTRVETPITGAAIFTAVHSMSDVRTIAASAPRSPMREPPNAYRSFATCCCELQRFDFFSEALNRAARALICFVGRTYTRRRKTVKRRKIFLRAARAANAIARLEKNPRHSEIW